MKIIFLCGSLEPGKDGVGDYVSRLMIELMSVGHEVYAIALHDKFIDTSFEGALNIENKVIQVLRIPPKSGYSIIGAKVKAFIKAKNPDLLSLQFVPFSFHNKGLSSNLAEMLKVAGANYKWHIMFHEPWIAFDGINTIKQKFLGIAQRFLIKRMVKKLNPVVIDTSNQHYQKLLLSGGITSTILALPSNIQISDLLVESINNECVSLGITNHNRNEWCLLGVFGKMRSNVSYLPLVRQVKAETEKQNKRLAFFSIGKSGAFAQKIMKEITLEFSGKVVVHEFGERNPDEISAYLQLLDYGVSSVSNKYLGKSGAVSAMRLHRLRILVPYLNEELQEDGYIEAEQMESSDFSARSVSLKMVNELENNASISGYIL